MDKTIRKVTSFEEQDAENFRYWQALAPGERLVAVWETTEMAYAFAGKGADASQQGSHRTLERLERAPR